ncbi:NADH-quinone oxidoreductase subunit NuoN [Demequina zhanjiangensis]|uniref:NADH-quinone oxidoreductase subunit N n=1 Tax=Demequina zhanjiangensis TaxID=3051659 RepID=A0ABT8FWZ6_9MICO|nr:NADH-quinone oxidoreductase subunit NuoN [Demequina sp. SYSU T00b26]MDN4471416.1 NADH-quinone oxidoreductase subunit NuoN [Demequina sp. SYSU T00b26]
MFTAPDLSYMAFAPIIIVLLAGAIGVLVEAIVRDAATRRAAQLTLTLVATLGALIVAAVQWATTTEAGVVAQAGFFVMDKQALAWQCMLLVFAALGALLFAARTRAGEEAFTPLGSAAPGSPEEAEALRRKLEVTEVFPLLLFAVGGMMTFASTTDYLALFVALEVFSLPLYIMVALARRKRLLSEEGALKYFLLGAFSSAIYLFGVALLYGAAATTSYAGVLGAILASPGDLALFVPGAILVLVGILFKLGAVPFHTWSPDAYQAAPTPVTAFMAAATKAAAAAALVRIVFSSLYPLEWELSWMIWTVAIVTMVVGTVVALVQTDIKRMLAYSSVAHAGFILVAFAGFSPEALSAVPFYLLTYGLATIGAFAVITQVREKADDGTVGGEATRLGQWAGLGRRDPLLAGAMALFLLSFAGIPLTAGFIGKFQVFAAAIDGGGWPLVLVAVLASAAAAFFYVRLIVLMFLTDVPEDQQEAVEVDYHPYTRVVVWITVIATVFLGVMPVWALQAASDAGVLLTGL